MLPSLRKRSTATVAIRMASIGGAHRIQKTTSSQLNQRQWCDSSFANCLIVFLSAATLRTFYAFFCSVRSVCLPSHIFFFSTHLVGWWFLFWNSNNKQMENEKRIKHPCNWFTRFVVQRLVLSPLFVSGSPCAANCKDCKFTSSHSICDTIAGASLLNTCLLRKHCYNDYFVWLLP